MTISLDPVAESATVRLAHDHEVERLSRTLALAFYDPVFNWFWAMRPGRFDRMTRFFRTFSLERATMPHGHVYTTGALAGAALWVSPGEGGSSAADTLRLLPGLIRMPAYLDATSPRNRRLYERHGFEVTGEAHFPEGPPIWPVWREPR